MNTKTTIIGAVGAMLLFAGCGDGLQKTEGEKMDAEYAAKMNQPEYNGYMIHDILGANIDVHFNTVDELYWRNYIKTFKYSEDYINDVGCQSSFAFAKRKAALAMSREVFCYSFWNYIVLDGVSGLIYNVSYIMQVPHKMLRGLRAMDGIWRYIKSVFMLMIGVIFAIVGLMLSPIVNSFCHPFETLSNLLVGVYSGGFFGDVSGDMSWFGYVWRTNCIASLWDLVWGGMLYPLWQALIFWL